MSDNAKIFYFGCLSEVGHHFYDPAGRRQYVNEAERLFPFRPQILDGCLLPQKNRVGNGEKHLSIINGWTIVSMWDNSVDQRPNSNSSFIVEGIKTREEVMELARIVFPGIVARIEEFYK